MFFARPGEYEPCGIFSMKHFILILLTTIGIIVALKKTVKKSTGEIRKLIKKITIFIWILETIKILLKLYLGNIYNVNEYVPLYYCSILLYACLMSSWGRGKIKRTGDVFLATGSIVGGILFLILPTTSLPTYPMLHFFSIHSFVYHGIMVYIGFLVNITHYINIELKDINYYGALVGVICIISYIINKVMDSNLMFISKDFPKTPITIIYNCTGKLFTPIMIIAQMTLPFLLIYEILRVRKIKCVAEKT